MNHRSSRFLGRFTECTDSGSQSPQINTFRIITFISLKNEQKKTTRVLLNSHLEITVYNNEKQHLGPALDDPAER